MSAAKTVPTAVDPGVYLAAIEPARRREEGAALLALHRKVTGLAPVMWGPSIIGFGQYHYKYDSGREGEMFRAGFAPRKANLVVYLVGRAPDRDDLLAQLGPHKISVSCLYLTRLDRVDAGVLEALVAGAFAVAGAWC